MTRLMLWVLIAGVALFVYFPGCHISDDDGQSARELSGDSLLSFIIGREALSHDTIAKGALRRDLALFEGTGHKKRHPLYCYLKGLWYEHSKDRDSALYFYNTMAFDSLNVDLYSLQQFAIFKLSISGDGVVSSDVLSSLLGVCRRVEKGKGIFLYRLYDLLAQAYYYNGDIARSVEYTDLYFQNHPYRNQPATRQRYYDISFMLAAKLENTKSMQKHLDSARHYAVIINNNMALARTYDFESQLNSILGKSALALESSRKFIDFLKSSNSMRTYALNNLATCFVRDGQPDSAIWYFKQAILWAPKEPGVDLFPEYQGLREAYKKKGDYKNALLMVDSALAIFRRNTEFIQHTKIEELRSRYQAEKKDQAIASLRVNNSLNEMIISQQRWIFLGAFLLLLTLALYLYTTYRRKLLREKNDRLIIRNKKLQMEQKALQLQLNPHFVYNCIANLQGLISNDKKKEADVYLVTFSHLMRNMLELNRRDYISLKEETDVLENYILLQQMRFKDTFEYRIDLGTTDVENILIPPMLLQPFAENSIEHGFKNISYKGMLEIIIEETEGKLHVRILDNGFGIVPRTHPGKKSLSRTIIQERLNVLFNQNSRSAYFEVTENLIDKRKGYQVDLYIPLLTV
ncbi:histidine kinase [Chryseobacterium sp. 22543]|uniref:histidine kinase n=1 Tax=Chryseobacterium sp. 22543 TaxID=3453940 RepID=UPI003F82F484